MSEPQRSQVSTDVGVIPGEEPKSSNCVADAITFTSSLSLGDKKNQGSPSPMITDVAQSSGAKDDKTKDVEILKYKMNHSNRGTCLVFNHEKFDDETWNRPGSDLDVERIRTCFEELGFRVVVENDLEKTAVIARIEEFSRPENHIDTDCVCVVVLTHGDAGDTLFASDGHSYESNQIWKPFTADKCTSLAGKPKLFFFQACRGKGTDEAVRMPQLKQATGYFDEETDDEGTPYTIPAHSDFLIAHSCSDGFCSWRDTEKGTWYIQSLCDVLDTFSGSTDLLKMMTITTREVAIGYEVENAKKAERNGTKQAPSTTSTLTKDLYFFDQKPQS